MHRVIAQQDNDEATLAEIEIMLAKNDICDLISYVEELWMDEAYLDTLSSQFLESVYLAFTDLEVELNMSSEAECATA